MSLTSLAVTDQNLRRLRLVRIHISIKTAEDLKDSDTQLPASRRVVGGSIRRQGGAGDGLLILGSKGAYRDFVKEITDVKTDHNGSSERLTSAIIELRLGN
jgi:hypothetical protein